MTKIAITGPATGTGTYTLRAPDTASTLDFELPTVGTHLASAQADGMPLGTGGDPVVESGSNTDGSWTRWADGTQICRMSKYNLTTTGQVVRTLNIPIDFVEPATFGCSLIVENFASNFRAEFERADGPASTGSIGVAVDNSSGSTKNVWIQAVATGRWK